MQKACLKNKITYFKEMYLTACSAAYITNSTIKTGEMTVLLENEYETHLLYKGSVDREVAKRINKSRPTVAIVKEKIREGTYILIIKSKRSKIEFSMSSHYQIYDKKHKQLLNAEVAELLEKYLHNSQPSLVY